jgi:hypothetical protein
MTRSSYIVLGFAVAFALAILLTARKLRTTERHTFAWLTVCAAIALLALWRDAIDAIAVAMGIHYPPSALFFGACSILLWLVYRTSLQVAEQRQQIKRLAQEVAILSADAAQKSRVPAVPASAHGP